MIQTHFLPKNTELVARLEWVLLWPQRDALVVCRMSGIQLFLILYLLATLQNSILSNLISFYSSHPSRRSEYHIQLNPPSVHFIFPASVWGRLGWDVVSIPRSLYEMNTVFDQGFQFGVPKTNMPIVFNLFVLWHAINEELKYGRRYSQSIPLWNPICSPPTRHHLLQSS